MSIPKRHHFLPEFYLRRWAGPPDGCLTEYRRPHTRVVTKRRHPAATGYQEHLYSVEGRSDPSRREEVESRFMSRVDTRAAAALAYIETTGPQPPDRERRSGWSGFLMSLLWRSPERIAWMKKKIHAPENRQMMVDTYDGLKRPGDPESIDDFKANTGADLFEEARAYLLQSLVNSPGIGTHINNMIWSVIHLQSARFGLLSSDSPLMTSNGLAGQDDFLLLPIGPTKVFIATNRLEVAEAFAGQEARAFERAVNDAVVRQADHLVIGRDGAQRLFVEKRLGAGPPDQRLGILERHTWRAPV